MTRAGPIGFRHIETAPKDGTFVRLRFRPGLWMPDDHEVEARWEPHEEMVAGGWWFTIDGGYVTPGPLFWAPVRERKQDYDQMVARIGAAE